MTAAAIPFTPMVPAAFNDEENGIDETRMQEFTDQPAAGTVVIEKGCLALADFSDRFGERVLSGTVSPDPAIHA